MILICPCFSLCLCVFNVWYMCSYSSCSLTLMLRKFARVWGCVFWEIVYRVGTCKLHYDLLYNTICLESCIILDFVIISYIVLSYVCTKVIFKIELFWYALTVKILTYFYKIDIIKAFQTLKHPKTVLRNMCYSLLSFIQT